MPRFRPDSESARREAVRADVARLEQLDERTRAQKVHLARLRRLQALDTTERDQAALRCLLGL